MDSQCQFLFFIFYNAVQKVLLVFMLQNFPFLLCLIEISLRKETLEEGGLIQYS